MDRGMLKKTARLASDTVLRFPNEIVVYRYGDEYVVVSPKDGNWLVVSEKQLQVFDLLKEGKTVGDVIKLSEKESCIRLLKQIVARDFIEKDLATVNHNAHALIYLTYDCNLKCEHCYMHAQRTSGRLLTVDEYREIFKALRENGVREVTFSGGEPLIRRDVWKIVESACELGLISKIFSNGTLWTDADVDNAKRLGVKVQISIDGVDEASSACVRGPKAFAVAKDVALRLSAAGVPVDIATTPIASNLALIEKGYESFVREMRDASGGNIKFKVTLSLLPGRNLPTMTMADKKDYEQRGIRLYSISNPNGSTIPFFDEYRKGIGREICGLGRMAFTPDGEVYVCSQLDAFPSIGNVREKGIQQLIVAAKKRVTAASVNNTIPCRDCSLRHICGGGCRAERFQFVSDAEGTPSIHNLCSEVYKNTLLKMMVEATQACYNWD